jgi:hypothetical protein
LINALRFQNKSAEVAKYMSEEAEFKDEQIDKPGKKRKSK